MFTSPDSPATILLADDSEDLRDTMQHMLRAHGYRVLCAADGATALEALSSNSIDVALLDIHMPGRSGFSVCREIKSHSETRLVPVVLITGLGSSDMRIEGIECGADDFLCKPVRKLELLARVRSLISLKRYTDELENAETVLCSLARSIEAKDPGTEGHCDRLSRYAVKLGRALGLSEELCVALRRGGIVHDIGKVMVPESILLKPGPLTPAERRVMELHPEAGERICSPLKSFRQVLPIIRHHHEKQDGSGYPDGLRGTEIPLTARILQTVDLYDALTTKRPYRDALTSERAFEILEDECDRGWWDRDLMHQFQELTGTKSPKAEVCVA